MDRFERLTTFLRIIDAGSLSAAARGLGMSVAAVSRQLASLEDELGATLVVRTTRQLSLTDAGRRFAAKARDVARAMDEAEGVVHDAPVGTVVLSVPVTFGLVRIVPLVPHVLAAHPRLAIDLRLDDRLVDLVGEGVDVAVRGSIEPPTDSDLVVYELAAFERVLVAAPALADRHAISLDGPDGPDALATIPALLQGAHPRGYWTLRRVDARGASAAPRRIAVSGPLCSNAPMTLLAAAEAGLGVALLPEWLVADALAAGRLVAVMPTWRGPLSAMRALHRVELRRATAVRTVVQALVKGLRGRR